ncbi:hypothetical protein [Nocardia sp. NPDC049526]|uniref:hypothetical protein n=1 Tax=Nocardia sp. NPDC049526 TaxID=3364316 RepID=UPI003799CC08
MAETDATATAFTTIADARAGLRRGEVSAAELVEAALAAADAHDETFGVYRVRRRGGAATFPKSPPWTI